jgi:hypothetical protein
MPVHQAMGEPRCQDTAGDSEGSAPDSAIGAQVTGTSPKPADLELPRPWRLIWTAGWNLGESVGLPIAAYLGGGWLGGQDAGTVAATDTP